MTAYYNENNPHAASWLRNLISAGLIAYGHVDDRSIRDVQPGDLEGFTQCHFFAGIGGWSYAARLAGWPDDKPLWTGSCPCQPFSVAGKRRGVADERHLWPDFFRLIHAVRPSVVMGEQVASPDGRVWFAGVRDDLENGGYAARGIIIPACAVGAPHRRERLWWLAENVGVSDRHGQQARRETEPANGYGYPSHAGSREHNRVGHTNGTRLALTQDRAENARENQWSPAQRASPCAVAEDEGVNGGARPAGRADSARAGVRDEARRNPWQDAEWLETPDGKRRRIKPGIPLLVDGLSRDVAGAIAGFGNAIVPQVAAEVLAAWLETEAAA